MAALARALLGLVLSAFLLGRACSGGTAPAIEPPTSAPSLAPFVVEATERPTVAPRPAPARPRPIIAPTDPYPVDCEDAEDPDACALDPAYYFDSGGY